ncbi:hypothetical protein F5B22DRAFT_619666 [Xylaria bambusicola]|uniref:uncharacterized protein n=1 Tax=Xylaria bambusicola TaxID=326684 RepID=UPI002008E5E3|nr:uncharacterized protein F5B22DRAFT_619666 [Xylaria bambusicola]KAI0508801.1 hypothetical protein F5B22DRAFT_619666 [Xylaria bambusicola]
MGNNTSLPKAEEGYETNNHTLEQEQDEPQHHHLPSDDLTFSSQINSSIGPAFLPPQRRNKVEYSSSPASRLHSSQAPTPIPKRKMSNSSPYQSSPAFNSSGDLAAESGQHENFTHLSKKKRKNKKRRSSNSQPSDENSQNIAQQPSTDLGFQEEHDHSEIIEDTNMIDADISASAQARSQHKKARKESKRAARLAKQQAEATSTVEPDQQEESRFRDLWLSQEADIAAKREQEEEGDEAHIREIAKTNGTIDLVEPAEPQDTVLRKRKRNSQIQTEHESHQASKKKRKKSYSKTADIAVENNEYPQNDTVERLEPSPDGEIHFDDLAEQLYSRRKRRQHHEPIEIESKPAAEAQPQFEEPIEDMDTYPRIESDLVEAAIVHNTADSAVDSELEEVYRDDDIDEDYRDGNADSHAETTAETLNTHHGITTRRHNAFLGASQEPSNTVRSAEFVTGVLQGELPDHQQGNGTVLNGRVAPSDNRALIYDIEVPSSLPLPTGTGDSGTKGSKRRASIKTSTGRKRVVKPDFFSRLVEEDIGDDTDSQSPSTAARSRKIDKGKGKQIAASEDEGQAGPSSVNGKSRPPKISSMLTDGPYSDADGIAVTPSNNSVIRLRWPKSPATLSGAFTDFEIRNLSQAIERFRDDHGMTQHQVNELIHGNPKEPRAGDLWENITATCPGRSRQKVINQTRRKFHNFVARGTWTAEQEQELREMYEQYGNKYAQIGHFINRHPEDVRDRIRNYIICGDKLKKDQWSQEESDRLVAIVEQAIEEIRKQRARRGMDDSRPVEEDINWQLVSQGMDRTRSRIQCIAKWKAIKPQLAGGGLDGEAMPIDQIIQQARETATTMSYRNRSLIIKEILKSGANADSRIPWLRLRNELGGQWTRPPLMVVWFRLRRTLPNWQSLNVKETCTLLMQKFQHTHKLEYSNGEENALDFDIEYREIEYRIRKGRKTNLTPKSAAFISNASGDEDNEAAEDVEEGMVGDQLDASNDEGAEQSETKASRENRHSSVDLSVGVKEREVADSEPETQTRSRPRRRRGQSGGRRFKLQDFQQDDIDDQSSDTNASQVSSILAR